MVLMKVYMVEMAKMFPKIITKNPEMRINESVMYPPCPLKSSCPDVIKINSDSIEIIFDIKRSLKYF